MAPGALFFTGVRGAGGLAGAGLAVAGLAAGFLGAVVRETAGPAKPAGRRVGGLPARESSGLGFRLAVAAPVGRAAGRSKGAFGFWALGAS